MPVPVDTVNASHMTQTEWNEAASGMLHLVEVRVLPAMELYRFATAATPDAWYAASWWCGKSAHEGLLQYAKSINESLSRAARRCLAVPPRNAMDSQGELSTLARGVRRRAQSPPSSPMNRAAGE
jgi:hypothetical protein